MRAPRYKDVTLIKQGIAPPDDQRGSASDSSATMEKDTLAAVSRRQEEMARRQEQADRRLEEMATTLGRIETLLSSGRNA